MYSDEKALKNENRFAAALVEQFNFCCFWEEMMKMMKTTTPFYNKPIFRFVIYLCASITTFGRYFENRT